MTFSLHSWMHRQLIDNTFLMSAIIKRFIHISSIVILKHGKFGLKKEEKIVYIK